MNAWQSVQDAVGVKFASLIAGFAGGVVSLSFIKPLTHWQMISAVVIGTVTAAYLPSFFLSYWHLDPIMEHGAAFLTGLTAMNVVPGILNLSAWLRQNPALLFTKLGSIFGGPPPGSDGEKK